MGHLEPVRHRPSPPCLQIRQALELRLGCPLQQYRDFIDNQMLLLMAQQDRASRIFPHLYLVSRRVGGKRQGWRSWAGGLMLLSLSIGLGVECGEPGGAAEKQVGFRAPSGLPALCLSPLLGLALRATWPETPRAPSAAASSASNRTAPLPACWQLPGLPVFPTL